MEFVFRKKSLKLYTDPGEELLDDSRLYAELRLSTLLRHALLKPIPVNIISRKQNP